MSEAEFFIVSAFVLFSDFEQLIIKASISELFDESRNFSKIVAAS